jgi:hypothetical protein
MFPIVSPSQRGSVIETRGRLKAADEGRCFRRLRHVGFFDGLDLGTDWDILLLFS